MQQTYGVSRKWSIPLCYFLNIQYNHCIHQAYSTDSTHESGRLEVLLLTTVRWLVSRPDHRLLPSLRGLHSRRAVQVGYQHLATDAHDVAAMLIDAASAENSVELVVVVLSQVNPQCTHGRAGLPLRERG